MSDIFYVGGEVFYDTANPSPETALLSPKCKLETNRSGSASFTILPAHWMYDSLEKMKTIIRIERDGSVLFRGRVIDMPSDLYGQRRVTCEGDMGFLLDSVQSPRDVTQTVSEFFTSVISAHNSQVEEWKRFTVGTISITEASQSKRFKIDGYQKTSDLLNSELLQEYGGIIRTRTVNGTTYIDYIEDPFTSPGNTVNSQEIRFAVNLVDYDEQYPINDLFTILLPIGRDNLTISSVNAGSNYLQNDAAVTKFGKIYHVEQWSDITDPNELKQRAQVFLNGHARIFPNDLKVKAIDLHHLDDSVEAIKMGDRVKAIVDPRGVDEIYYCLSIDYDFVNPENDEYWIGTFIPSDKQKGSTAESSYGGGCGDYGGGSLSETSADEETKNAKNASSTKKAIQHNEDNIAVNAHDIAVNANDIAVNAHDIAVNANDIAVNANNIGVQARRISFVVTDDENPSIKAAEITASINNGGSQVYISASKIIMDGNVTVQGELSGLSSKFGQLISGQLLAQSLYTTSLSTTYLNVSSGHISRSFSFQSTSYSSGLSGSWYDVYVDRNGSQTIVEAYLLNRAPTNGTLYYLGM